jgi:carboxyl-terminal processing protease
MPTGYAEYVLDVMEWHWLHREEIDWERFRAELLESSRGAAGVEEIHALVRRAFEAAGDRHSKLLPVSVVAGRAGGGARGFGLSLAENDVIMAVYAGGPAARAGLRVGERLLSIEGLPVAADAARELLADPGEGELELVVESAVGQRRTVGLGASRFSPYLAPSSVFVAPGLALVELPAHSGDGSIPGVGEYGALVRRGLEEAAGACGLVVDLRRNVGGNMWPMLEGVAPLLPEGSAGAFVYRGGSVEEWPRGDATMQQPVAVLTSGSTASSGEALVVAFRRRPLTGSFGEATYGVPSAIRTFTLPDGARLNLAVAAFTDRQDQSYHGHIVPDERVAVDWAHFGTPDDPVVQAALDWLRQQEGCTG